MNLPFVLDVAIGLIFIYLILSLLASEIQELLATLLQWRAVHLQRSIEMLLTGGEDTPNEDAVKNIVNELYSNPLLKNLNQEAKEGIEAGLRQFTWGVAEAYWKLTTKRETIFGKDKTTKKERRSGPSYIPAETFSTTLLDNLKISQLSSSLTTLNLLKFKEGSIKSQIKEFISDENLKINEETRKNLNAEVERLEQTLDKIFNNFKNERATLITSVNQIKSELDLFIENCKLHFQQDEALGQQELINSFNSLKDNIFHDDSKDLVDRLKPSLTQVIDTLDTSSKLYQGLQEEIGDKNSEIYITSTQIKQEIKGITDRFPKSVIESLSALAIRAQIKVSAVEEELNQFKNEIEVWFDRSMERASGVYKRNAKGVTFLIGFILALAVNADTFHIISRLSKDTSVRTALITNSGQLAPDCLSSSPPKESNFQSPKPSLKLDCLREELNQALDPMALPIGWSDNNLQEDKSEKWQISGLSFSPLKKFLGWVLSGFAVSMGAPFWFELLGKIVNVRNTGAKPQSSQQNQNK